MIELECNFNCWAPKTLCTGFQKAVYDNFNYNCNLWCNTFIKRVIWDELTSSSSRKKLCSNFSQITQCHGVVLEGTRRLLIFKVHHFIRYQYFRSHCAQEFKLLHNTILIIIYVTVRPYDFVWFEKNLRPSFLQKDWASMFLKPHIFI